MVMWLRNITSEDAHLVAAERKGGFVAVFLCRKFGCSHVPAVFQVDQSNQVGVAASWKTSNGAWRGMSMIGWVWCLRQHMEEDMEAVRQLCKRLLGKDASDVNNSMSRISYGSRSHSVHKVWTERGGVGRHSYKLEGPIVQG